MYNAMSLESVNVLVEVMNELEKHNMKILANDGISDNGKTKLQSKDLVSFHQK